MEILSDLAERGGVDVTEAVEGLDREDEEPVLGDCGPEVLESPEEGVVTAVAVVDRDYNHLLLVVTSLLHLSHLSS